MFDGPRSAVRFRRASLAISTAAPNSLTRITRPNRIGWQRIHVHLGMPNQRNSLLDRLGPDVSVAL